MKFDEVLAIVGNQPLFETGLLLAGDVDPNGVRHFLGSNEMVDYSLKKI
jgi:hypothetical protein